MAEAAMASAAVAAGWDLGNRNTWPLSCMGGAVQILLPLSPEKIPSSSCAEHSTYSMPKPGRDKQDICHPLNFLRLFIA